MSKVLKSAVATISFALLASAALAEDA